MADGQVLPRPRPAPVPPEPDEMVRELRRVVEDLLGREGITPAHVRFVPHQATAGRSTYFCQVYAGDTGLFVSTPRWLWWSDAVASPHELQLALQNALRLRRRD